MAEKKKERIKIYITIGLAVVLVISGYFRLIHAKTKRSVTTPAPQPSLASINIPKIQTKPQQETKQPEPVRSDDLKSVLQQVIKQPESDRFDVLQSAIRDIFAEPVRPAKPAKPLPEENQVEEKPKPPPPMTLKGTIVGGKRPIAIINDRFVRMGDRIGDYQVVEIDKDKVKLSSGNNEIVLEVLKYVSK